MERERGERERGGERGKEVAAIGYDERTVSRKL